MRKITLGPIVVFSVFAILALAGAAATTHLLTRGLPDWRWIGTVQVVLFLVLAFVVLAVENRIFLKFFPLPVGEIAAGSRAEFIYHVNLLFYLLAFYPVTRSRFVPVPLMRLVYQMLGARLGKNTYCSGIIMDPSLTTIGDNTLIGQDALLFSHAIEGEYLALSPISIGSTVTVGAKAVIMSGTTIEDRAIVAAGSVVRKGTRIGAGEIWGGIPARRIGKAEDG